MTLSKRNTVFVFSILIGLALSGCAVSLASDITPPPNSESYSSSDTPVPTESVFPIVPPDPQSGRAIFDEKCTPCHGELGLGDGPQSGELPVPVPALGDVSLASSVKPVEWYNMVTNGNLERYMPGFKSLDDRQRWDVVAYALSLSLSQQDISDGQIIYSDNCLSCHGDRGQGGQEAPDWAVETGRLAQLSLDEIAQVTSNGKGEMPGYGTSLNPDEIAAVSVYVRSLSFVSNQETVEATVEVPTPTLGSSETSAGVLEQTPIGTAETFPPPNVPDGQAAPLDTPVSENPSTITITGMVKAPEGMALPDGLTVTLVGFDSMSQAYEAQTQVKSDASFEFEEVEFVTGRAYMATLDYQGLTFSSDVYHSQDGAPEPVVDLSITFYETTSDLTDLKASRMHMFFDFTRSGVVQVVELFILNNTGNRAIVAPSAGAGVVEYNLPEGAVNLQFQDSVLGERYLQTASGFSDTSSILPGEGSQILFAYDLPYERKLELSIPMPFPVDAAVIMVPQGTVEVAGDQIQATGTRDVQGISLDMYTASSLPGNSTLDMTLSGRVSSTSAVETSSSTGLLVGGGILGVVLVGAGFWLWRQRKTMEAEPELEVEQEEPTVDSVMDAIIALDDRYQAGDLPEDAYQARRSELKNKLQSLMK